MKTKTQNFQNIFIKKALNFNEIIAVFDIVKLNSKNIKELKDKQEKEKESMFVE